MQLFWGEQQATVALVAVACIFLPGILTMEAAVTARKIPLLEKPSNFSGTRPLLAPLAVDGTCLAFYFLTMILFGLKVLLAIGAGLVMTALL